MALYTYQFTQTAQLTEAVVIKLKQEKMAKVVVFTDLYFIWYGDKAKNTFCFHGNSHLP